MARLSGTDFVSIPLPLPVEMEGLTRGEPRAPAPRACGSLAEGFDSSDPRDSGQGQFTPSVALEVCNLCLMSSLKNKVASGNENCWYPFSFLSQIQWLFKHKKMKCIICFNTLHLEYFIHHKLEIKERAFLKCSLILFFNFLSFC